MVRMTFRLIVKVIFGLFNVYPAGYVSAGYELTLFPSDMQRNANRRKLRKYFYASPKMLHIFP